jgi:acetoacetyl-CoA synthetase
MISKKDAMVGFGILSTDVYFQYTTVSQQPIVLHVNQLIPYQTGWMMWPFMLVGLACGARVVIYDGSPFHPDLREYLKFIHDQGCDNIIRRSSVAEIF